ncbi:MAG: hypothetical protein GY765_33780 [bacterium]|nr:hypothetical protein [bacterium]
MKKLNLQEMKNNKGGADYSYTVTLSCYYDLQGCEGDVCTAVLHCKGLRPIERKMTLAQYFGC